jgi:hypothetical protein
VEQFRGGLVLEARRLLYHSTLGSRVLKKGEEEEEKKVISLKLGTRSKVLSEGLGIRVQGVEASEGDLLSHLVGLVLNQIPQGQVLVLGLSW